MLTSINSCEIVSLVTAISCGISNCVPKEDLPKIAAILGQVASTLTTIAVLEGPTPMQPVKEPEVFPDVEIIAGR